MMSGKTKKILIRISVVLGSLLLLAAGLFILACGLLFDKVPAIPQAQKTDIFLIPRKMAVLQSAMRECTMPKMIRTLSFTEEEFNSLLKSGSDFANPKLDSEKIREKITFCFPELKNGVFHLHCGCIMPYNTPFGNTINCTVLISAEWKNGKPLYQVISAKAGAFSIPGSSVGKIIDEQYRKNKNNKYFEMVKNCLISFRADGKNVVIQYDPFLLAENIDRQFFGGRGFFQKNILRRK